MKRDRHWSGCQHFVNKSVWFLHDIDPMVSGDNGWRWFITLVSNIPFMRSLQFHFFVKMHYSECFIIVQPLNPSLKFQYTNQGTLYSIDCNTHVYQLDPVLNCSPYIKKHKYNFNINTTTLEFM